MLAATVFFFIGSLILVGGIASPTLREIVMLRDVADSKHSLLYAEGAVEDVVYRLITGMDVDTTEVVPFARGTATVTVATTLEGKEVLATGDEKNAIRKVKTVLREGIGVAFNYGMQSDTGGIVMENSSSVRGNVYSNGSVVGAGSNLVTGAVISAGPSGLVDGVHATGSVYAHTISDSTVEGDAYYETITSSSVLGTQFPDSPDQATSSLPITDEMVEEWEAAAEAGGVITSPCPYQISSNITLGPVKIACDVQIQNNPTVTFEGHVWVVGSIEFNNAPHLRVDSSLGNKSVALIADNPADPLSSSRIDIKNSASFEGSGAENSYVMLVSQNASASSGGGTHAIEVQNNVSGDLLVYAGHGEILLQNSASLKEVSAFRIRLQNSAEVVYETGLASLLFDGGPGGGWEIETWEEVE